ncbi:integral membrane protein-permease component%2C involved in lipoprotein release [Campylobacter hyointestinalis subsp. hyointestinalis]|uniref:Integral membrane protein-permease component, involved in lipoprotein release n=1 Tax=Campylobacter hyointestinalis subsp. hyointestinalis TaxID=91352 RepID=A0A9W5AVK1_CAMHY|nr:FtsX-like permease family protein [Campylobacter hyointestinalis]PPB51521.1 ABC transporter permease [Campylobacter hyointestinalis subsp. hyointestinalis]PPB54025.1 ABC transporter permease [Campylobacter hyointestinalis subsp. hyointestinalis]PPB60357.1 ABC transporter permease [Campylobacter hyointestinalis subsp. hyointestinalis]PPB65147.1 ABC transporter permease [Campylobacter hyointestinalis subsp. hyointestinalis]CUU67981.1 integral membrane protein-permease component%2C involved in
MVENKIFFIKIIFKSILSSRRGSFVMFISILFGAAIASALINLYTDIDKKVSSELNNYGANVVISPLNLENNYINENELNAILNNIKDLKVSNKYLFGVANIGVSNAVIMGLDFANLRKIMPYIDLKSGEFIASDDGDKFALIGADLAKIIGAKPGDILEITPSNNEVYKVRIKGVVYDGQKEDNLLMVSLDLAQDMFGKEDLINYANAIIDGDFDNIKKSIENVTNENIKFEIIGKISKAQGQILDKIKLLMFLIGVTILFITTVGINTTLSSILFSKVKEFALIRSLGSSKASLLKLILSEVFTICIVGSILGGFLGYVLAIFLGHIIFSSGVDFRLVSLVLAIVISLVFALLASFYPIKKALNQNIANLLRE